MTLGLCAFLESCDNISTEKKARELDTTEETTYNHSIKTAIELEKLPEKPIDSLAKFDKVKSQNLTNNARLIAGVKLEKNTSFANNIQQGNYWLNHHNTLQTSWAKLEARQLSKVRKWSGKELAAIHNEDLDIFYPFSGPDFLYIYNLFPRAKKIRFGRLRTSRKITRFTANSAKLTIINCSKLGDLFMLFCSGVSSAPTI